MVKLLTKTKYSILTLTLLIILFNTLNCMCETMEYSTGAPYYVSQNNNTTSNNNTTNNNSATIDYNSYNVPNKNSVPIEAPSISNSYSVTPSLPNSNNKMPSSFNEYSSLSPIQSNNANGKQLYEIFNVGDINKDNIPNSAAIRSKDFIHGTYSDYYTISKSVDAIIRYWKTGKYFDMLINQIKFSKYKCTAYCDGNEYLFYANSSDNKLDFEDSAHAYLLQCMNSGKTLELTIEAINSIDLRTYTFIIDTSGFRDLYYMITTK